MIIKKFQGSTETEAIMLAKEELGKDAIVLNIKTISPKGIYRLFRKQKVEITAALDDSTSSVKDKTEQKPTVTMDNRIKSGIIYESNEPVIQQDKKINAMVDDNYTFAIESKLNNLQNLLEKQLIEKNEVEAPIFKNEDEDKNMFLVQLIYNQLLRNEVDEKYINQILSEIDSKFKKEATLDTLLSNVYQKLVLKLGQPKTIELVEGKTKFIYFIGPTGVGKTTTIAKIASNLKLDKKVKVALLTSDTYRIAAVEQLRTYANILSIPIKVIYNENDINELMDELKDYDVVLVDTAGRSHKSEEQRDNINALIGSIDEELREIYLVLSATTKYSDLIQITERYSEITNYRLIFTKLDETSSYGNIFNIRMLTSADLSYTTNGQNVPDDINKLDAQQTAKKLLGGNE